MAINASAKLSKENLFTQSYANIFNLINNKNNVPDPVFGSASTRTMVYSREPDEQNMLSEGYPFIIIWPTSISTSVYTVDSASSLKEFSMQIEIRCTDRVRGKEGKGNYAIGIQYVDQITDSIIKTLNDKANRHTLIQFGMGAPMITTEDIDAIDLDEDLIWVRTIIINSSHRLRTG